MRIEFPVENIGKEEKSFRTLLWENKVRVGGILCMLILSGTFIVKVSLQKRALLSDFFLAQTALKGIETEGEFNEAVVTNLLSKHPELTPLFQHTLIDQKVFEGEMGIALGFVKESLQRMNFIDPVYKEYGEISLLIEEGRHGEGLEKTEKALLQIASLGIKNYPHLYMLSLIRGGMLSLSIGETEKSKEMFSHAKRLLNGEEEGLSLLTRNQLISHLHANQISFFDFIEKEVAN